MATEEESLHTVGAKLASAMLLADEFDDMTDDDNDTDTLAAAPVDDADTDELLAMPAPLRPLEEEAGEVDTEIREQLAKLRADERRELGLEDNDFAAGFWSTLAEKYKRRKEQREQGLAAPAATDVEPLEGPLAWLKKKIRKQRDKGHQQEVADRKVMKASERKKRAEADEEIAVMRAARAKAKADASAKRKGSESSTAQPLGALPPLFPLAAALPPLEPFQEQQQQQQATPLKATRTALAKAILHSVAAPPPVEKAAPLTIAASESSDDWFHVTSALVTALATVRGDAERTLGAPLGPLVAKVGVSMSSPQLNEAMTAYASAVGLRMAAIAAPLRQRAISQKLGRKLGETLLQEASSADYAKLSHVLGKLVALSHTQATNNAVPKDAETRLQHFWTTTNATFDDLHSLFE